MAFRSLSSERPERLPQFTRIGQGHHSTILQPAIQLTAGPLTQSGDPHRFFTPSGSTAPPVPVMGWRLTAANQALTIPRRPRRSDDRPPGRETMRRLATALLLAAMSWGAAQAQDTVKIVVPFAAGGPVDAMAR